MSVSAAEGSTSDLAIHGGEPVRPAPMPPRFAIGPEERRLITEVLDDCQARGVDPGYQGPFEERYNQAFADYQGGGYADAVATGTVSIYVALAALDLPKGSSVLVSPITDPGTLSAIILNGLKPKLVDAAPGTYAAHSEQFVERFGPDVSAVVPVHNAGTAIDIENLVPAAQAAGIRVLEDCSQAHGALRNGKKVGTFGDIAAFSTMYRKASITGASGGVVYTKDEDLYHMTLAHADRGKPRWIEDFDDRDPNGFLFPALNLHTDEISCAIGLASLGRLDDTIRRRQGFIKAVTERIESFSKVCCPIGYSSDDSPFIYTIFVDESRLTCSKRAFAEALLAEGIGLNAHYMYVVRDWAWVQPHLADDFDTTRARDNRDRSFCLYVNENYGEREADDVAAAIRKVEQHFLAD